jgi:hypothetical protein
MNKSKAAFLFTCRKLAEQALYMWTFTLAELLSIKATRKRWNHFLTLLLRTWPELQGVRVFELHEEHGLHVHLATNRFIDVNVVRDLAEKAGWGRIHVMPMPPEHVEYLAKYLAKDRPDCFKRWRLWAAFGKTWEPTKVKDVSKDTLFSKIYRACKEWQKWEGRGEFSERMAFVRIMLFKTIENGWTAGLGPSDKPYWMCSEGELEFGDPGFDAPF